MWTRTPQPGLWFVGGAFSQARIYSRYVAAQIDAIEAGRLAKADYARDFFPSPLVGEGGAKRRMSKDSRRHTPHPPPLRSGTFSHKGRREEKRSALPRHCERSEAIQISLSAARWIASLRSQ